MHDPERIIQGNMIYELEYNSRTVGAMPDIVDNNKDRIIIETGDYNGLADVLTFLIENKIRYIKR